jgi:hypothetical protein
MFRVTDITFNVEYFVKEEARFTFVTFVMKSKLIEKNNVTWPLTLFSQNQRCEQAISHEHDYLVHETR